MTTRTTKAWVVAMLCAAVCACAQRVRGPRLVFAHYMLANQDYVADDPANDPAGELTIASYAREIRQAQALGIDGFALNAGGWLREPRYIRRASEMFEAALRVSGGFRLMFSADMCCGNEADDVEDMMRRFAGNPRYAPVYFRHDGRFVLTTFAGAGRGVAFWKKVRSDLERGGNASSHDVPNAVGAARGVTASAPMKIELVPAFFFGGETPDAEQVRAGIAEWKDTVDGALYWGIAGVPGMGRAPDQVAASEAYAGVLHAAGKLYMAPVAFQFWGANAGRYYEYSGYQGMRRMWMDAIERSRPEWVEILTWNDFVEGTYISPIDDPARYGHANDLGSSAAPAETRGFFPRHAAAAERMKFFIAWYKTGREPRIVRDDVFWAYRPQLKDVADRTAKIRMYGPVADVLYVIANLCAAAELRVFFGASVRTMELRAGSHDVELPMVAGSAPRFELWRAGKKIVAASGADAIAAKAKYPDLYESTGTMHD